METGWMRCWSTNPIQESGVWWVRCWPGDHTTECQSSPLETLECFVLTKTMYRDIETLEGSELQKTFTTMTILQVKWSEENLRIRHKRFYMSCELRAMRKMFIIDEDNNGYEDILLL